MSQNNPSEDSSRNKWWQFPAALSVDLAQLRSINTLKLVLFVARQTFGWRVRSAIMSYDEMRHGRYYAPGKRMKDVAGLRNDQAIIDAIRDALDRGLLEVQQTTEGTAYRIPERYWAAAGLVPEIGEFWRYSPRWAAYTNGSAQENRAGWSRNNGNTNGSAQKSRADELENLSTAIGIPEHSHKETLAQPLREAASEAAPKAALDTSLDTRQETKTDTTNERETIKSGLAHTAGTDMQPGESCQTAQEAGATAAERHEEKTAERRKEAARTSEDDSLLSAARAADHHLLSDLRQQAERLQQQIRYGMHVGKERHELARLQIAIRDIETRLGSLADAQPPEQASFSPALPGAEATPDTQLDDCDARRRRLWQQWQAAEANAGRCRSSHLPRWGGRSRDYWLAEAARLQAEYNLLSPPAEPKDR